jgi:hypothetical protein
MPPAAVARAPARVETPTHINQSPARNGREKCDALYKVKNHRDPQKLGARVRPDISDGAKAKLLRKQGLS